MKVFKNQPDYWDKIAGVKNFSHPLGLDLLIPHIDFSSVILDYGCGYGRICQELWANGYKNVLGVDPSQNMIERGRREYPYLDLQQLDTLDSIFSKSSYDAVLLFSVLTCIPEDKEQQTLLELIFGALRPGGVLYLSDLPIQKDQRNIDRYEKYFGEFGVYGVFRTEDGGIFRHHSMNWIEKLTMNFEKLHLIDVKVTTMNGHQAKGFQYLCRKSQDER
jgi:SAM-dependent methyltransferase